MQHASVRVDADKIVYLDVDRAEASIAWDDLTAVLLETTDKGPFEDDLFWILEAAVTRLAVPSETPGADDLIRALERLPGFDNEAVIDASTTLEPHVFVCWRRDEA